MTETIWKVGNPTPETPEATLYVWVGPRLAARRLHLVKIACPDTLKALFECDILYVQGWRKFFMATWQVLTAVEKKNVSYSKPMRNSKNFIFKCLLLSDIYFESFTNVSKWIHYLQSSKWIHDHCVWLHKGVLFFQLVTDPEDTWMWT